MEPASSSSAPDPRRVAVNPLTGRSISKAVQGPDAPLARDYGENGAVVHWAVPTSTNPPLDVFAKNVRHKSSPFFNVV